MDGSGLNRTLSRALDILESLANREVGMTLAEIAAEFQIPVSSAHGLVKTLEHRGYVERGADKRYQLGIRMFHISRGVLKRHAVSEHALKYLKALTAATGETSHLVVPAGHEVVFIEKVESPQSVRASAPVGTMYEMHMPATGKALLAFMPEASRRAILEKLSYAPATPRTITSREALEHELQRIAERGYSVDDEEVNIGVRCLAAPIFDYSGDVVAAIGITGPTSRVRLERIDEFATQVRKAAAELSRALGAAPERLNLARTVMGS